MRSFRFKELDFQKDEVTGTYATPPTPKQASQKFKVVLPDSPEARSQLIDKLHKKNIDFQFKQALISDWMQTVLMMVLLPLGFLVIFYIFFIRQAQKKADAQKEIRRAMSERRKS